MCSGLVVLASVLVLGTEGDPPSPPAEAPAAESAASEATSEPEPSSEPAAPQGVVTGVVVSEETAEPVAEVQIVAAGGAGRTVTGADGTYRLELSVGTHELSARHPRFTTATQSVDVREGGEALVVFTLPPLVAEVHEVVVTAPVEEGATEQLLQERRTSSSVSDLLGAEEIAKAGDSDTASALQRVTGLTVIGGRYVYVRGMGERYASTLLDGSQLSSPEPERRVVPLDLFPAGVLDSVVVQKTYSPELPGEFSGGTILLRTRGTPNAFEASVGVSSGYTARTTLSAAPSYVGGPTDFFGFGVDARALPPEVREASEATLLRPRDLFDPDVGYTQAELERFGEAMNLDYALTTATAAPDLGLDLRLGGPFELLGVRGGYVAGVIYGNDHQNRHRKERVVTLDENGDPAVRAEYRFREHHNTINLAALGNLVLDVAPGQALRLTVSVNRISDLEARSYRGFNDEFSTEIDVARLRWLEEMLVATQVSGGHELTEGGLRLDWRYMLSVATGDDPDQRQSRYDLEDGAFRLSTATGSNHRIYSTLDDLIHDAGVDLELPWTLFGEEQSLFKAGAALMFKDRAVQTRRYVYQPPTFGFDDERARERDAVFSPDTIGENGFTLDEGTLGVDAYAAQHLIGAAYVLADLGILPGLKVMGGVRLEFSRQTTDTFPVFRTSTDEGIRATLETFDPLPAAAVTWEFITGQQLRAAVSRTVNRPDLRELTPSRFFDVEGGYIQAGSPALRRASIINLDLRWEWYPDLGESVSAAAFAKIIDQPIEREIIPGAEQVTSYFNSAGGQNLGLELEARKRFGFVHPWLADLYAAANLTLVWSQVDVTSGGAQTTSRRPLEGQSPFVVNAQLGYEREASGTRVAVLYNVFGARIYQVGSLGIPDVYEQPVHRLDVVVGQEIGESLELSFKAKNLLDLPQKRTQGDIETYRHRSGWSVSLGLTWAI